MRRCLRQCSAGYERQAHQFVCLVFNFDAAQELPELRRLDLRDNSIGDKGLANLAEALELHGVVSHLDLAGNAVGDDGAKALAHVLAQSRGALRSVRLESNCIGEVGIDALSRAMATNGTVTQLELGGNMGGQVQWSVPASSSLSTIADACMRNAWARKERRRLCCRLQLLAWAKLSLSSGGTQAAGIGAGGGGSSGDLLCICWDLLEDIGRLLVSDEAALVNTPGLAPGTVLDRYHRQEAACHRARLAVSSVLTGVCAVGSQVRVHSCRMCPPIGI